MPVRETDAATVFDESKSSTQVDLRRVQIIAVAQHTHRLQVAIWIVARWQTPEAVDLCQTDTAAVRIADVQLCLIASALTMQHCVERRHLLDGESD